MKILQRIASFVLTFALLTNATFAATFTVNDSGDASDASAGNGTCATAGSVCTLRAALVEANALAGPDTIVFDANARTLTPGSTLTVDSNLTLDGNGAGATAITIDGNNGAFDLITVTANADSATIHGLYLINGGQHGINIASGADSVTIGTLTEQQGNIIGVSTTNTADGMAGAGIYHQGTNTTILGNIISSNATGIDIRDGSKDITIMGNTIGATPDVSAARGNGTGINVQGTVALDGGNGGTEGLVIGQLNSIVGSTDDGIRIGDGSGDISGTIKIQRNYIGMTSSGTAMANADEGIMVESDADNADITIGTDGDGTQDSIEGNYIGSNGSRGINLFEGDDVVIAGNKIGLNASGSARGNTQAGISIGAEGSHGPTTLRIGSDNADANEMNTIGNNGNMGIHINNATTVTIAGNYIGFDTSGTGSHPNTGNAISVGASSLSTLTIGGNGTAAAARNFIGNASGGGFGAIYISDTAASATVTIKSNIIGLASDFSTAASNNMAGMYLTADANYTIGSNGDGANDSTEYNVVSGNNDNGIYIGNGALIATIAGNIVGLASADNGSTWTTAMGNGQSAPPGSLNGLKVASNSLTSLTIGGDATEERNVIGNHPEDGINVTDAGSAIAYTIRNNYIGLASDGTTASGNTGAGMDLDDGGTITLTDNVVANNGAHGIDISAGTALVAKGNKIGTTSAGTVAAGNTGSGLLISASTMADVDIGGSVAGEGNTVADSTSGAPGTGYGINIADLAAGNTPVDILGNYIGIGSDGTTTGTYGSGDYLGNASVGIRILEGAVTIGGNNDLANGNLAGGNVISNNGDNGVMLTESVTTGALYGNIIGLKKGGTGIYNAAAGNRGDGFEIDNGATSMIIGSAAGTTTASKRNIISANGASGGGPVYGVHINAPGGPGGVDTLTIQNNYIGTDITGTTDLGNFNGGMTIEVGNDVIIGSELDGTNDTYEGNVISGNNVGGGQGTGMGVIIQSGITMARIYGNIFGLNATKTADLGNEAQGIVLYQLNSSDTVYVGSTSNAASRNFFGGNGDSGLYISGGAVTVQNNYFGVAADGRTALPDDGGGIYVSGSPVVTINGGNLVNNVSSIGATFTTAAANESTLDTDNLWLGRITGVSAYSGWVRTVGDTTVASGPKACHDGLDNDSDGKYDYPLDPGCSSETDNDEFNNLGGGGSSSSSSSSSRSSSNTNTSTNTNTTTTETTPTTTPRENTTTPRETTTEPSNENLETAETSESESSESSESVPAPARQITETERFIVETKIREAVNTTTDTILSNRNLNYELVLQETTSETTETSTANTAEAEAEEPQTADQIFVKESLAVLHEGEALRNSEIKKVETILENEIKDELKATFTESVGSPEAPKLSVRTSTGKEVDIQKDTKIEFVMDVKEARNLQKEIESSGENKVVITPSTMIGNSRVSAMVNVVENVPIDTPLAAEKVFFRGINGLKETAASVEELLPPKPKITNLENGMNVGNKPLLWVAAPRNTKSVTVFVIDKKGSTEPQDWDVQEVGEYKLDAENKAAISLDLSDKMRSGTQELEFVVQDSKGRGEVVKVNADSSKAMRLDAVYLKDGEQVEALNLQDSNKSLSEVIQTSVLNVETEKALEPGVAAVEEEKTAETRTVSGYAEPGTLIFVTWKSLVMNSVVIADAKEGYFEVPVPTELAKGEHEVLVYSYNRNQRSASNFTNILFNKIF